MSDNAGPTMLGAIASSAGDDFHQLWGMRKVLALLDPNTNVVEIKLEGLPIDQLHSELGEHGQIVDLTTKTAREGYAPTFHYEQLKYSPSNPGTPWTWARLIADKSSTKKQTSILSRLASLVLEAGEDATFSIVTNQPAADCLKADVERLITKLEEGGELDDDLARSLRGATGRNDGELLRVLLAWDLSGFGAVPRLKLETDVIKRIGELTDADARNDADLLQQRIATLMLPEGMNHPPVTRETVLTWLGSGSSEILFPAPSRVQRAEPYLRRRRTNELVDLINAGGRPIRLSAPGGCGKTSLVSALHEELPQGSEVIVYDCYGGGLFMSSDDRRHLPERALVQVSNDIAVRLDIPVMLRRETSGPIAAGFLRRMKLASEMFRQRGNEARLVIVFDASDNSAIAAEHWKEDCFISEVVSLSEIPDNVCLIFTCRDARRATLGIDAQFRDFALQAFDSIESRAFVGLHHTAWVPATADTLHDLTGGTPRRLAYAIDGLAEDQRQEAIARLMPKAAGIDPLFEKRVEEAGRRLGDVAKVERALGVLAFLPRPIPAWVIAELSGLLPADVLDVANDLGGIKERQGGWSFHDEDFEFFARERAASTSDQLLHDAADLLFASKMDDPYAARVIGEILMRTQRYDDLYDLVRSSSQSATPLSGIEAKLVHSRRLALAINCCKAAGDLGAACSLLISAADEMKSVRLLKKLLLNNLPLACKFAPTQTMEIVFSNARSRGRAGPMRIHLAAACAATLPIQAREHVRWWRAALADWSQQDKDQRFAISSDEIASEFVALRQMRGIEEAVDRLLCWRPQSSNQAAVTKILRHLVSHGPEDFVAVLGWRNWPPIIRTQLMAAAILAGAKPSNQTLQDQLSLLAATSPCRWESLSAVRASELPHFAEATLIICENLRTEVECQAMIVRVLEMAFPRVEFNERSDISRFARYADFYARAIATRERIAGTPIAIDDYLPEPKEIPKRPARDRKEYIPASQREKTDEELWNESVRDAARQLKRLLAAARADGDAEAVSKALKRGYDEYGYHSEAESIVRFTTAWLVQSAVSGQSVEARLCCCFKILKDWQSYDPKKRIAVCVALSRTPGAHGVVLEHLPLIATDVETMAATASERSELMMSCAHAALPVDEELARDFFERALRLTEKVDVEALSQLELAAVVAEAGIDGSRKARVNVATILANTASAADATLGMEDHFPWSAVVRGVAAADLPTGLAAISQWRDFGTLSHYRSIPDLLSTDAAKALAGEDRFALSILAGDDQIRLSDCFENDQSVTSAAIDRYCRDALVTGDQSVILRVRWEEPIAGEQLQTAEKKKLQEVAGKLLEWRSASDDAREAADNHVSPIATEAEVVALLSELVAKSDRVNSYAVSDLAKKIANPSLRTAFLRKAAELAGAEGWFGETLLDHLEGWKSYPPVATWAREELPVYLAASMTEHFEWNYRETSNLDRLLNLTGLPPGEQALIIFEGIHAAKRELHAELVYSLAGLVAVRADKTIRAGLLRELLERLNQRLDQQPKFTMSASVAPNEVDLCLARMLYATMSDIDREVRWNASHAVLVLAQHGRSTVIGHLANLLSETTEDSFAYQEAPFYAFAAQEQLLVTLYRAAVDRPALIASTYQPILDITLATSHLIVRELGKRLLLFLAEGGHIELDDDQRASLARINLSPFEPFPQPETHYEGPVLREKKNRQFRFDDTDTIPYWYSTPAAKFAMPFDSFLDHVEGWVNGKWGFVETDSHWLKEPRIERLRGESGNSDHRHGTIPRIERLSRYVEWHGMMHAVGELVAKVPLIETRQYEDTLYDWIEDHLPTLPPYWVSDLRMPPPLQPRFWGHDDRRAPDADESDGDRKVWPKRIPEHVFDDEIGLTGEMDLVTVGSSFCLRSREGWEDVQIRSGLVTTETADALGHALLTVRDHMDFIIPPADDSREIAEDGFVLRGWLCNEGREPKMDKFDTRRGAVYGKPFDPYRKVKRDLGLEFLPEVNGWALPGIGEPSLRFDFWGSEEERSPGNGWRATASSEMLAAMLQRYDMSMILSVEIARGMTGEHSYKRQWRIYIVDPTGAIRKVERKRRSLGRYWVRKLGFDHSCDTLMRWRLHRLAELVDAKSIASAELVPLISEEMGTLWNAMGVSKRWPEEWDDSSAMTFISEIEVG